MYFRRSPELDESLRAAVAMALRVRRLSESGELPVATLRRTWPVRFHWRRPGGAYELSRSRPDVLPLLRLCALLSHSYVLAPVAEGLYFTSELEKDRGLFFVEWATVGQMVEAICDHAPLSGVIHAA